jgi:hypothetical protein
MIDYSEPVPGGQTIRAKLGGSIVAAAGKA